ncbi:MAG: PmoA family protein [Sedimentisphaerales bacterium]|nr:PmoA family protein [Sedimentisphaerales bacterium]
MGKKIRRTVFCRSKMGFILYCLSVALFLAPCLSAANAGERIELQRDDQAGQLNVTMDGRQILAYQYGSLLDLPHYWPLLSPSGRNMLTQMAEPYPHHRSLWFADTIRFPGGKTASFYNALYTGTGGNQNPFKPYRAPFGCHVAHTGFQTLKTDGDEAVIESTLVWTGDNDQPMLDEQRTVRIRAFSRGEYLLDMTFKLTAAYNDVEFVSDNVHYAWPYIRLNKTFNGQDGGGVITSDGGNQGQKATDGQVAKWIDYSRDTEGMAVFQWPDGQDHRWLTREYGCFGPRRPDETSGRPFTLKKGRSIGQRVGILVHTGNVTSGRITERYRQYIEGKL